MTVSCLILIVFGFLPFSYPDYPKLPGGFSGLKGFPGPESLGAPPGLGMGGAVALVVGAPIPVIVCTAPGSNKDPQASGAAGPSDWKVRSTEPGIALCIAVAKGNIPCDGLYGTPTCCGVNCGEIAGAAGAAGGGCWTTAGGC